MEKPETAIDWASRMAAEVEADPSRYLSAHEERAFRAQMLDEQGRVITLCWERDPTELMLYPPPRAPEPRT